jgi:hypothetical protein
MQLLRLLSGELGDVECRGLLALLAFHKRAILQHWLDPLVEQTRLAGDMFPYGRMEVARGAKFNASSSRF